MVFHWSLSARKSPQVSRIHLRIRAILTNAVTWIVSTRPQTSKSSRPFNNPLVIAPIPIGTIISFMLQSFSILLQGRSTYPSSHFPSDLFCGPRRQQSRQFCKFSFLLLLIIIRSGPLAGIRWSVFMLKFHRSLCVWFSRTGSGLTICLYGQS